MDAINLTQSSLENTAVDNPNAITIENFMYSN